MIKENIAQALSDQAGAEYYSAYLYFSMAAYADHAGFKGVANWLFIQAREELAHGTRIFQYLLERGASPAFGEIKAPPASYGSVKELFEKVLAHEQEVTGRINHIATLAAQEKDHAAYQFISWYVNEQVEEESNVNDILSKLRLFDGHPELLYNLDAALASRVFTEPFAPGVSTTSP
jgi:ferritin